ncbi:hypothetical protein PsAD2_01064 [Pseudovibrio axinellae]|uniref:Uncharacterized protein n=1 Tax=Pseudovibrio axinellae TaxID=989403 RepID=A0A166A334_9HYPH|nr:DUF6665 family protein [Pseudovibrio axinellae]KZL20578.1 hypothetical protein PsAD2_01064 [Pseudovibrio axinellae]SER28794.1 hypothetical protein SAMN05421798_107313 [Pseudovibrio axinellae]
MSFRLPQTLSNPLEMSEQESALAYEISQEKAQTLGRLGRQLASKLKDLANETDQDARNDLKSDAAGVLYEFMVFREACGLTGAEKVLELYNVPVDVRARMGPNLTKAR